MDDNQNPMNNPPAGGPNPSAPTDQSNPMPEPVQPVTPVNDQPETSVPSEPVPAETPMPEPQAPATDVPAQPSGETPAA